MDFKDRERLVYSSLLAVPVYIILFFALNMINWDTARPYPDYKGPLYVQIQTDIKETIKPVKKEKPEANNQVDITSKTPIVKVESGSDNAIPAVDHISEQPASQEHAVSKETPLPDIVPADIWSEGSRIEYDEPVFKKEVQDEAEEIVKTDENSIFGTDVEALDRALESPGGQENINNYTTALETDTISPSKKITIKFDKSNTARKLLSWKDPDLSGEFFKDLPPDMQVVITCILNSSGYIEPLNIKPSLGYSEGDAAIFSAVRLWKFESLPQDTGGDVEIKIYYRIRVR